MLTSLFCLGLLLVNCKPVEEESTGSTRRQLEPNYEYYVEPAKNFDQTKGISVEHSATPVVLQTSATNYEPYVKHYHFTAEDAVDKDGNPINQYNNGYVYEVVPEEDSKVQTEFSSIETDSENYQDNEFQDENLFLDTSGFKHYKTQTSFNLEGPRQMEKITTKSYHKEVEPYDVSSFKHESHHHEEEEGEVHYHQHKHLHKHNHKQEHMHKHEQKHKHEHGHKHKHHNKHQHHHENKHHHSHHAHHKHGHKNEHHHKHHQEHKHSHHQDHKHDHHHLQEHKHDHHHGHSHSHHSDHKHSHHQDHKHDHHHSHSHHNDHKHSHSHHGSHKHEHGHKHGHKHEHHSHHKHSHKHKKH